MHTIDNLDSVATCFGIILFIYFGDDPESSVILMKIMIDTSRSKGDAYLKTLYISGPEDDMALKLGPLAPEASSIQDLINFTTRIDYCFTLLIVHT